MVVPNLILLFIFIIFILSLTSISRKTFIEIKKQKAEKAAQPKNQADG
jgi:biopolymer transport protein ExbD